MGEPSKPAFGGQAVLEGVMMRGPSKWAVAVRRPDGLIWLEQYPSKPLSERRRIFKLPFLRGISVMGDSLSLGARAMSISARQSMPDQAPSSKQQKGGTIAFSILIFIGIFIILPNILANVLKTGETQSTLSAAVKESLIRLGIFVGYILLLSAFKEARRLFQYHGAEHQTIHAFENADPLTPEAIMKHPTEHVRCGTNFLIITILLTIVAYSLLGRPALWIQLTERVLGLFVIAGASYEFLRLGATRGDSAWVRALMRPGIWLQKMTTKQPTADMVEVAVRSFEAVMPAEERHRVPAYASPVIDGNAMGADDGPSNGR